MILAKKGNKSILTDEATYEAMYKDNGYTVVQKGGGAIASRKPKRDEPNDTRGDAAEAETPSAGE